MGGERGGGEIVHGQVYQMQGGVLELIGTLIEARMFPPRIPCDSLPGPEADTLGLGRTGEGSRAHRRLQVTQTTAHERSFAHLTRAGHPNNRSQAVVWLVLGLEGPTTTATTTPLLPTSNRSLATRPKRRTEPVAWSVVPISTKVGRGRSMRRNSARRSSGVHEPYSGGHLLHALF